MQKPANAKGTRDFGPEVLRGRKAILKLICELFEQFGFEEIQTPAVENLSTLTGKYGEEGDKLLFKVLDNGELLSKLNTESESSLIQSISQRGLRYDLTVPFARFVAQHRNEISFPFRRYQVQEVWRADRPQKGRYREFTQCDADIIGSRGMINEADLLGIYEGVFIGLGLNSAVVKLNHRKLLEAVVEELGISMPFKDFAIILDKLDKIGQEGVAEQLRGAGLGSEQISDLFNLLVIKPFDSATLTDIEEHLQNNSASIALTDLRQLLEYSDGLHLDVRLDLTLARGLDYYTGCIFEAIIEDSGYGSVSGGGRYDELTAVFGLQDVSGVGISFGIDRLYDVMSQSGQDLSLSNERPLLLFCHFDLESAAHAYQLSTLCRKSGLASMVYPDQKKLKKQMDYANKRNASHVIVVGTEEVDSKQYRLKDMKDGSEIQGSIEELIASIQQ